MESGMRAIVTLTLMMAVAGTAAAGVPAHGRASAAPAGARQTLPPDARRPNVLRLASTYRLWPGRAPGATSDSASQTPTITWYPPPQGSSNGTAVIIAPGGAYIGLAAELEGTEPASWFTTRGVTAFVLQYRVGLNARLPIPLFDGARAVRFVRAYAAQFHINPHRIGMMGFSAGGHLTAMTAVQATRGNPKARDPIERVSSRPDFIILGYPWLQGTQLMPNGHSQYCDFAIDATHVPCDPRDYVRYNPLRFVTAKAPPTFMYLTSDDGLVPPEGALRFYEALWKRHIPVEMHIFEPGGHGSGFGGADPELSMWPQLLQAWMRHRGLLPPPAPAG
jgi:acetyl esterase/lipase